jgi:hypothetical protein
MPMLYRAVDFKQMDHIQSRRKIRFFCYDKQGFSVTTSKVMNALDLDVRVTYLPGLNKHGKKDFACHFKKDFRKY